MPEAMSCIPQNARDRITIFESFAKIDHATPVWITSVTVAGSRDGDNRRFHFMCDERLFLSGHIWFIFDPKKKLRFHMTGKVRISGGVSVRRCDTCTVKLDTLRLYLPAQLRLGERDFTTFATARVPWVKGNKCVVFAPLGPHISEIIQSVTFAFGLINWEFATT